MLSGVKLINEYIYSDNHTYSTEENKDRYHCSDVSKTCTILFIDLIILFNFSETIFIFI